AVALGVRPAHRAAGPRRFQRGGGERNAVDGAGGHGCPRRGIRGGLRRLVPAAAGHADESLRAEFSENVPATVQGVVSIRLRPRDVPGQKRWTNSASMPTATCSTGRCLTFGPSPGSVRGGLAGGTRSF